MKVLILTIGCQLPPWDVMPATSLNTWDKVEVENVDTVYYFGNPVKENTDKFIYFPIEEGYSNMGYKMIEALDWCLKNKEFDFLCRVNSSCYVDKKKLIEYVSGLPEKELFAGGVVAASENNPAWCWGGLQFVMSKDVVQGIIKNKDYWDHTKMDDVATSYLVTKIGVSFTNGIGCSIDKTDNGWRCLSYGCESIEFTDFNDVKRLGHHFYRVKQDGNREMDAYLMNELFKVLK